MNRNSSDYKSWLMYLLLASIFITLVNIYIVQAIQLQHVLPTLNLADFLSCEFYIVWNRGSVLGLMSYLPSMVWALITITILAYILYCQYRHQLPRSAIFPIVTGGLSNTILRLYYTAVPDYIHCQIQSRYFFIPATNINDLLIISGMFLLALHLIISFIKNSK